MVRACKGGQKNSGAQKALNPICTLVKQKKQSDFSDCFFIALVCAVQLNQRSKISLSNAMYKRTSDALIRILPIISVNQ